MSMGRSFKQGFNQLFNHLGGTVLIHKNWDTPQQVTTELRGLKNSEKNRPQNVMFQFPDRIDVVSGDVVQQKGAADLWRVVDVEDRVIGDVYVHFTAKVEKMGGNEKHPQEGTHIVVHGANYGGIQVAGPKSTQSINVENLKIVENLEQLRSLGAQLPIDDIDKEELGLALDRIEQLARKPKSDGVIERVKEKLDFVNSIFSVSKDVATLAMPYIGMLLQTICK
jgi:hypothetical protein